MRALTQAKCLAILPVRGVRISFERDKFANNERKQWTPQALQRLCFGSLATRALAERYAFVRRRQLRRAERVASQKRPVTSARAQRSSMLGRIQSHISADLECSREHIRSTKCVAAHIQHQAQLAQIRELPRKDTFLLQLSLDETEMRIGKTKPKVGKRKRVVALTAAVMMLHGRAISVSPAGKKTVVDTICAPSILQSTSAACILNGVQQRLPMSITALAQYFGKVFLILMTDAARSCKKAGRLFGLVSAATYPVIVFHFLCAMHQLSLCVSHVQRPLRVLGAVFCASNLIHKGATWELLQKTVHRSLATVLITLEPPDPRDRHLFEAVLQLLEWDTDMIPDADLARLGLTFCAFVCRQLLAMVRVLGLSKVFVKRVPQTSTVSRNP